jgi:uridine kinase
MKSNSAPFLVAIVGGSGSGKSWLAERLEAALDGKAARLSQDDFYHDRSLIPPEERAALNFDHPDAIDWQSLEKAVQELMEGRVASLPTYDFKTHCRDPCFRALEPKPIILMEGLWLLRQQSLRDCFDLKVFIECSLSTRLRRRIERDLLARGRSRASVEKQFYETVEPMHREFVSPQKRWADVVLPFDLTEHDVRQLANKLSAKLFPEKVSGTGVSPVR